MFLAQATTQPAANLWTPGEVSMLITVFGSVVIGGFFAGWRMIIEANTRSKLAILAAQSAGKDAVAASTKADANATALGVLHNQVTAVALSTPPSVSPVTFEQAEMMRQAGMTGPTAWPTAPPKAGE
jgi:hypothetical protein